MSHYQQSREFPDNEKKTIGFKILILHYTSARIKESSIDYQPKILILHYTSARIKESSIDYQLHQELQRQHISGERNCLQRRHISGEPASVTLFNIDTMDALPHTCIVTQGALPHHLR
jgi:hypothetical protein